MIAGKTPGEVLDEGLKELGLTLSTQTRGKLLTFLDLLLSANRRLNLTAVTDPADAVVKHILDSLSCLSVAELARGELVADVGSGGGLPGIPLKLARPGIKLHLIESTRKKASFLAQVMTELGLDGTAVFPERAEALGHLEAHREKYDTVVVRAVGSLRVIAELCLPLVRPGGRWIAFKGPGVEAEIDESRRAVALLGGSEAQVHRLALPFGAGDRSLVILQKTGLTSRRFPRRPGVPARKPL